MGKGKGMVEQYSCTQANLTGRVEPEKRQRSRASSQNPDSRIQEEN